MPRPPAVRRPACSPPASSRRRLPRRPPPARLLLPVSASALALLLGLSAPPAPLPAAPEPPVPVLTLELWCELEPIGWEQETPVSEEQAARRLLEEARQTLSAMLYGYRFLYIPADSLRGVAETFQLEPIGEVAWGDGRLRILSTERGEERLYARLEYRLEPAQSARRSAWSSNVIPRAAGDGTGSLLAGPAEKQTALRAAIREAIRNHLRPRILNKPREIRGEVLLWSEPRTVVRAGLYQTRAEVKVRVTQVVPYRIF